MDRGRASRGGVPLESSWPTACAFQSLVAALIVGARCRPPHPLTPRTPSPWAAARVIVINGETFCTLTAIGNDNRGNLDRIHVRALRWSRRARWARRAIENAGVLGEMVAGNDGLDYAVIKFDPQKVHPVNNVDGFQIDGLGPDPLVGDIACKLGRTTGYSCGVTWGPGDEPGTFINQVCGQPGDSGAPVTVNNRLVGMIHGAFSEELPTCIIKYIPLHTPAVNMSFNTQLADIVAKNRPGSGFVPVGAAPAA